MTKVAISGGTGIAGRFIVERFLAANWEIVLLGRQAPGFDLFGRNIEFRRMSLTENPHQPALFDGCGAFVHAAFHHQAGKYRGGEGDDPATFRRANIEGSLALFKAARKAGVRRSVFLSSRAVYGKQEPGSLLDETREPNPDTLYGKAKLETERALLELSDADFLPLIVRSTGIYGASAASRVHKWSTLFAAVEGGEVIEPRAGTEIHGEDLAEAILLLLGTERSKIDAAGGPAGSIFNASDIMLDRQELVAAYASLRRLENVILPAKVDCSSFNMMDCTRLKSLGWRPRGKLDLAFLER